jgi:hypothetical protein
MLQCNHEFDLLNELPGQKAYHSKNLIDLLEKAYLKALTEPLQKKSSFSHGYHNVGLARAVHDNWPVGAIVTKRGGEEVEG